MDIKFIDNSKKVLEAFAKAKNNALTAIGITGEKHAKDYEIAVDTGLLRNSITYAISGEQAATAQYSASKAGSNKKVASGSYSGTAPNDEEKSVYIGTNVKYAEGIETGSHRRAGGVHFLQKAVQNHTEEYKKLAEQSFESVDI